MTADPPEKASGARRVVLSRYRPEAAMGAVRPVHLIPLPVRGMAGTLGALCGTRLSAEQIETLTPGEGLPCTLCFVAHLSGGGAPPPVTAPAHGIGSAPGLLAAAAHYRAVGWPATLRHNQVSLSLTDEAVALIMPTTMAAEVTTILATRRCPAPVLAHPHAPDHRIVVVGEPFGAPLPWPDEVHTTTGSLLLPPTCTPLGPVTWAHPPQDHALNCCREIDVFGAVLALAQSGTAR